MKKQLIKYAILSLVLLFTACGTDTEYATVIPKDAEFVVTLDLQSIITKSGLLDKENSSQKNNLKVTSQKDSSEVETALLEAILKNPGELGIDLAKKMYAFEQADTELSGLLFPVLDKEKLKTSIMVLADHLGGLTAFHEEGNYQWTSSPYCYIAMNEKSCVFMLRNEKDVERLNQKVASWLIQGKDESFVSTPYFDDLHDLKGEIGLYASMQSLPENMSMMASLVHSESMDMMSIKYLASLSFQEGRLEAEGRLLYEDDNVKKWLKHQQKACKRIKGTSLTKLPLETPLWFAVGLDGNELYNSLLEHPTYGRQLQNISLPLDIEGVVRTIDGDLAVSYPHGLYVDVKNNAILSVCVGAINTLGQFLGFSLDEIEKDHYELIDKQRSVARWLNQDVKLHMGMNDESFYLLTSNESVSKLPFEKSLKSAPWVSEVEGNILFLMFNFQEGNKLLDKYISSPNNITTASNNFSYITYSQKDIESNKIVLTFIDKKRNVLQQLLELLPRELN